MRKIIYALLVLLPVFGVVSLTQAEDKPAVSNITVISTATFVKTGNFNFGTVRKAEVTKKFTITNRGPAELQITAIGIKETETKFQLINNNCLNGAIKKWGRCQFSVKYSPSVETFGQTKTATLYIEGNLKDTRKEFKLTAKDGLRPIAAFSLFKNSNSNLRKNNSYTFNFGPTRKAVNKTIFLRNIGNTNLNIKALNLQDSSSQWVIASASCTDIAPNKSCPIKITFTPKDEYYKKQITATLMADTNDPVKNVVSAVLKTTNMVKPATQADTPAPVGNIQPITHNDCPYTCVPSSLDCVGDGKTIDWSEAHSCHSAADPICCNLNQAPTPAPAETPVVAQNNCPGTCVASSLDCIGSGKNADWTEAHSCHSATNPVCCITTPAVSPVVPPTPATQACPGECIASETSCYGTGQTIDRTEAHRCTTYGLPVCCISGGNTPPATPPPAHAAACTETDGYLGVDKATDFNHRGTITGYDWDGTAFNYTDFCTGNSLTEYFCQNPILNGLKVWYSFNANCAADPRHECRDGACACKRELDADGDGICDTDDHCPGTPAGTWVNFAGCVSL